MATDSSTDRADALARLIHRETVQLLLLGALAVAAFFVTRALAASNRETTLGNGVEWYRRGTSLARDGDLAGAVESFRRAAMTNRREPTYVLALADALSRQAQNEAARTALLSLRESRPEDPEVNLRLGRLAAGRGDIAEAVSYYRNTLYAPWRTGDHDRRRQVRLELIDFLLGRTLTDSAIAELMALTADMPDEPAAHLELAYRFARAGDTRNALTQFQHALRRAPRDMEALAGAGNAAFELGEYQLARRYLRGIPRGDTGLAEKRDLVDLIIAGDPLLPRLGAAERRQRLSGGLSYARDRLAGCHPETSGQVAPELQRRVQSLERELQSRRVDTDAIEEGLDVIAQLIGTATRQCPPSLRDRALVTIAQRHAADRR
jgi:Flp pilus assembly protein TadD